MEIRQVYRILTFAYITALPSILIFWILTLLPEIIVNNLGVTDKSEVSKIAGLFEASFFIGLIVGSLIWPYALNFISKKNALLLGMVMQALMNALTGQMRTVSLFIFLRFLTACCSNVNTIGKDFIFVFAKVKYRQYAYSVKNVFSVMATFAGPILGYFIYEHYKHNLSQSIMFISVLYIIGILMFILVFYIDFPEKEEEEEEEFMETDVFKKGQHNLKHGSVVDSEEKEEEEELLKSISSVSWEREAVQDKDRELSFEVPREEKPPKRLKKTSENVTDKVFLEKLKTEPNEERPSDADASNFDQSQIEDKSQDHKMRNSDLLKRIQSLNDSLIISRKGYVSKTNKTFWEVVQMCFGDKNMRSLIIVYFLTNGVYKAQVLISIFFLETAWRENGFGLNPKTVATINVVCFLPVALFILISPTLVPTKITYAGYTKFLIFTLCLALIFVPFARDLISDKDRSSAIWVVYLIQAIINISTPKMYSPFLNYILNRSMDKDCRTSLNSITFILSNLSAASLVLLVVPLFSVSMYDPGFTRYAPWNKYFCFIVMDLMLLLTFPFIKAMDKDFFIGKKSYE